MNFDEYQNYAKETDEKHPAPYYFLQLQREASEAAEIFISLEYKNKTHKDDLYERLKEELGDVLWFVAVIADSMDLPLSEIAQSNIDKLRGRYNA